MNGDSKPELDLSEFKEYYKNLDLTNDKNYKIMSKYITGYKESSVIDHFKLII